MTSSELVQAQHLQRKAVIYIRQSSPHQVSTNLESGKMQRAMTEHARHLGWSEGRIEVVEVDTGTTAKTAAGRNGYKDLLSEVALGNVGIVLSYESARLSRNCSDWYPLLDVCTLKGCLIADRDGVYDPASVNGRLILGMKGILSELELHTLRGRLTAGIQNKARRGELALALPAGLVRQEDGRVVKDPDLQVQQAIGLVFDSLIELKSACKVRDRFRKNHLKLPRRHRNAETIWRQPTTAAVLSILKNPAYAGAFAYGKTQTVRTDSQALPRQRRRAMEDWPVLLHDRYPAYVSWGTFQRIQSVIEANHAEYQRKQTRGVPRNGDALLQGVVCCGECGHKMSVTYKRGARYLCQALRVSAGEPTCQNVPAQPVDAEVVAAFFAALSPAELDLYDKAMQSRRDAQSATDAAQERELQRLRYEADLARRRYERIDPDNRLVAAELERRWEVALRAQQESEGQLEEIRRERDKVIPLSIPRDLKDAFESFGQSLPDLWEQDTLSRAQRKALLRCLIDKVVLQRRRERWDHVEVRIVWRGGAVSELEVPVPVGSLNDLSNYEEMEAELLTLEAEGNSDEQIARTLTENGYRSSHSDRVLPSTVKAIRLRNGRLHRYRGRRPRRVDGFLTVPQIAEALGVTPHWLYNLIRRGRISIQRDQATRMYLFPERPETVEDLRRLRDGEINHVSS
jgi:DNA invertase Pin-like site-specific DNA recombinase